MRKSNQTKLNEMKMINKAAINEKRNDTELRVGSSGAVETGRYNTQRRFFSKRGRHTAVSSSIERTRHVPDKRYFENAISPRGFRAGQTGERWIKDFCTHGHEDTDSQKKTVETQIAQTIYYDDLMSKAEDLQQQFIKLQIMKDQRLVEKIRQHIIAERNELERQTQEQMLELHRMHGLQDNHSIINSGIGGMIRQLDEALVDEPSQMSANISPLKPRIQKSPFLSGKRDEDSL